MKRAYIGIRQEPHYRRDAFVNGLKAVGYDVRLGPPRDIDEDTVYVSWNRYNEGHEYCNKVEQAGGTCLIAENAYLGPQGQSPHEMNPRCWYALSIGYHNGAGSWHVGGPERFAALNVELKPWRTEGSHVLILPNRSFGVPELAMPYDWPRKVVERLQRVTKREIRVRPHPGNGAHKTPLAKDLENAWAAVIWSSSAGVQALIEGVPVVYEAPYWICSGAASRQIENIESGFIRRRCRLESFRRMSFAQWRVDEIASGEAFRRLLQKESIAA